MTVEEYFKMKAVVTQNCTGSCYSCPLYEEEECSLFEMRDPKKAELLIAKAYENVKSKTRQAKFLAEHPYASVDENNILLIQPCHIDYRMPNTCPNELCSTCRRNYWMGLSEDEEDDTDED